MWSRSIIFSYDMSLPWKSWAAVSSTMCRDTKASCMRQRVYDIAVGVERGFPASALSMWMSSMFRGRSTFMWSGLTEYVHSCGPLRYASSLDCVLVEFLRQPLPCRILPIIGDKTPPNSSLQFSTRILDTPGRASMSHARGIHKM